MATRKGTVRDMIYILTILFTVSLFAVAMYGMTNQVYQEFKAINNSQDNNLKMANSVAFLGDVMGVFGLIDIGSIVLIGVFFLGAAYSAVMIQAHRIFIIPSLLLFIASLYMAQLYSQAYAMIANIGPLTSMFNAFPKQLLLFDNLGITAGAMGMIIMIATYWKTDSGSTEVGL